MLPRKRIVSHHDLLRLTQSVEEARNSWSSYVPFVDLFWASIRRSRVVPSHDIPPDVITMNSQFELRDFHTGKSYVYTVVFPEEAMAPRNKLSVLSPMGMAILGSRVGDEVCWQASSGPQVATIERLLHQPESVSKRESLVAAGT